ncbi:MAG: hypothetical protein PHN57_03635 [Candidatus Omnitrophica bacterium]|nr:hypothetical protein [Candidatus Omnitrophota bacterium]
MNKKILCSIYLVSLLAGCFAAPLLAQEAGGQKVDVKGALQDFSQMSPGDKSAILSASGLPQVKDFDPVKIVAYVIFGGIGFVAFAYGKKTSNWRPLVIGIVLMAYPYFFSQTLAVYLIGIVLTSALYFWRE